jgi:predicted LPLAT superfamily acyltransferase
VRRPRTAEVFKHFYQFGLVTLDRVGFWVGTPGRQRLEFHGREHFDTLLHNRTGAVLLGAHIGSFDALRVLADGAGIPVNVVMSTRHAPRINRVLRELNPRSRARVIEIDPTSGRSVFELRACLDRGEFVSLLADRTGAGERTRTVEARFLGEPATFPAGPFVLASRLQCPVLLMIGIRRGPGRYVIYAEPFADRIELPRARRATALDDIVQRYANRLEAYCRRAPYQWFNFYDFWRRDGS